MGNDFPFCNSLCVCVRCKFRSIRERVVFRPRDGVFRLSATLASQFVETYEEKPILEKFEFALLLLRKPAFDRGARPFQDVKVLIDLRNALTHFKPEWMNEADEHAKMSRKLDYKIDGSVFLQASELLFPRRWASHSGTRWAVNSALAFAKQFEANAALPLKYKVGDMTVFDA